MYTMTKQIEDSYSVSSIHINTVGSNRCGYVIKDGIILDIPESNINIAIS